MHEIHDGSDLRLSGDPGGPGVKLSLVDQCLMFVFGWADRGSTGFFL